MNHPINQTKKEKVHTGGTIRTLDDLVKKVHRDSQPQPQLQRRIDHSNDSSDRQGNNSIKLDDEDSPFDITDGRIDRQRRGTASALIIAAAHKSGLTQSKVDRAKIDAILLRESANSEYMKQQRRRDECVNIKIDQLRHKLEQTKKEAISLIRQNLGLRQSKQELDSKEVEAQWKAQLNHASDTKIAKWTASAGHSMSPAPSTCVVVDMDSFYISCELLTKPHLRDVPCCVGSPSSIISTSNYKAREYGVRSAMGGWIAQTLVKELSNNTQQLIFLRSNFDLYRAKSEQVMEVLKQYDPNLSSHSLDEAYINLGPYLDLRIKKGLSHEEIQTKFECRYDSSFLQTKGLEKDDIKTGIIDRAKVFNGTGELPATPIVDSCESKQTIPASNDRRDGMREEKNGNVEGYNLEDNDDHCTSDDEDENDTIDDDSLRQTFVSLTQEIIKEMRSKVQQQTGGLTCSAGIGSNHMIAKIASDINKPNGQKYVASDKASTLNFLHPLPIRRVPGIGRVMEKTLQAFDIDTVKQLFDQRGLLPILFKPVSADFLLRASVGLNSNAIAHQGPGGDDDNGTSNDDTKQQYQRKGIGRSRTFATLTDVNDMLMKLEEITKMVSNDMLHKGIRGRTFTVSVKLHTFDVFNKAKSLSAGRYTHDLQEMKEIAKELFQDIRQSHLYHGQHQECQNNHHQSKSKTHSSDPKQSSLFHVRLLGLRCHNLIFDNVTNDDNSEAKNQLTIQSFLTRSKEEGRKQANKVTLEKSNETVFSSLLTNQSRKRSLKDFLNKVEEDCENETPQCSFGDGVLSRTPKKSQKSSINNDVIVVEGNADISFAPSLILKTDPANNPSQSVQVDKTETKQAHQNEEFLDLTVYECPICQQVLHSVHNNHELNCHIDSCLNSKAVRKVVKETQNENTLMSSKTERTVSKKESQGISSFFCTSKSFNNATKKNTTSNDDASSRNRIKKMKEVGWQKIQRL